MINETDISTITATQVLLNFANNVGYMFNDVFSILTLDPVSVGSDYTYNIAYYLGDFSIRWLFSNSIGGSPTFAVP